MENDDHDPIYHVGNLFNGHKASSRKMLLNNDDNKSSQMPENVLPSPNKSNGSKRPNLDTTSTSKVAKIDNVNRSMVKDCKVPLAKVSFTASIVEKSIINKNGLFAFMAADSSGYIVVLTGNGNLFKSADIDDVYNFFNCSVDKFCCAKIVENISQVTFSFEKIDVIKDVPHIQDVYKMSDESLSAEFIKQNYNLLSSSNVTLRGVITDVQLIKTIKLKTGTDANLRTIGLSDHTGTIKVTLWRDHSTNPLIQLGAKVILREFVVSEYRGVVNLQTSTKDSSIELCKEEIKVLQESDAICFYVVNVAMMSHNSYAACPTNGCNKRSVQWTANFQKGFCGTCKNSFTAKELLGGHRIKVYISKNSPNEMEATLYLIFTDDVLKLMNEAVQSYEDMLVRSDSVSKIILKRLPLKISGCESASNSEIFQIRSILNA